MKGKVKVFWKAELLSRQSSLFEGSRSQASIDDDTTMMKGGDHCEGQLHYEFQTKVRSIIPRSTAFSLPVAVS